MNKNYTITLKAQEQELVIDIEEFECICQQMAAIQNGYGHDYEKVFVQEETEEEMEYTWEENKVATDG
jgi:hypothetical protein